MSRQSPEHDAIQSTGLSVEFDGVGKRYGTREILKDISFCTEAGECLGLLGPNGAGKTTMFKLILALTEPDRGRISVAGAATNGGAYSGLRASIGFLPESVTFDGGMSGSSVLAFYGRLKGASKDACNLLLTQVGLEEAALRAVRTYSKGMRQRLGLAQALLATPRLLLLDEPTTGLDPAARSQFFATIGEQRKRGVTVIMSSHALAEMEAHMDRFAILGDGRLLANGSLDDLKQKAGLATRIRLEVPDGMAGTVAQHFDGRVQLDYVNEHRVDLSCLEGAKMEVMRELATLKDRVVDVELNSPRLEDLYSHFTSKAGVL